MNVQIFISDYNKDTVCSICNSNKTSVIVRNNRGSPLWLNYKGGKICVNCNNKLKKYPKELNLKKTKYRLDYKGINLFLSFQLPREKCELCGILKDKKGKNIHRHHYFYIRIMPWACTISICSSCHTKITRNSYKNFTKNFERGSNIFS